MSPKLKYIQLNNGTELISKVNHENWEVNGIELIDPLKLYVIPPFLSPVPSESQTIILIRWLPWADDVPITISPNKLLVVTNVSKVMTEYYNTTLQKYIAAAIEGEPESFNKIAMSEVAEIEKELDNIEDLPAPKDLEELTELLNQLAKSKKKQTLH